LPVLTGIGHSTNLTVAEMVSYRNAITPTELGDFLIQAFHNFSSPIKDAAKSIKIHSLRTLELTKVQLGKISSSFSAIATGSLGQEKLVLQALKNRMKSETKRSLQLHKEQVGRMERSTVSLGRLSVQSQRNKLQRISEQLPMYSKSLLLKNTNELDRLVQSVRLMDPINVLNRGFSITTFNGKTINDSNNVKKGDVISTRTAKFTIESEVTSNTKEHEQRD
jgi:exodeoxyribonuclease VII large subunit